MSGVGSLCWADGPMVGFDLETTSPHVDTARIVSAAVITLGRVLAFQPRERDVETWLARPGVPIPGGATAVHGITDEHAAEHGRPWEQVVAEIVDSLNLAQRAGIPIVGHNVSYDFTVLDREARRAAAAGGDVTPLVPTLAVDTLVLDKAVDRYRRGKRTLTATCQAWGVTLNGAHDAGADARAALDLAVAITGKHPAVGAMPLPGVHQLLGVRRAEQSASLQEYLRRTTPGAVVDGTWPVHPLPAGWDPAGVDRDEKVNA